MTTLTNRQQDCLRDALGYLDNATGALQELIELGNMDAVTGCRFDRLEMLLSHKKRDLINLAQELNIQDPQALYEEYRTAALALQQAPADLDWAMGQPYGALNREGALRIHTDALAAFLPVAQKFLKSAS